MTDQVDMSQFIAARSDQLNADDLMDSPRTITITKVTASPDSAEQPVSIHFEGENTRVFKPCKTVRRILVGVWGKDASQYVGRSMTLYRDPSVAFGGMQVGGIRVSHMSNIDGEKTVALMVTRGRKAPFKVLPLKTKIQPADDQAVALKALTEAAEEGLEALGNVWKQKWMAPHREALQIDLDRLKLVAEAKSKPQPGGADPVDKTEDNSVSVAEVDTQPETDHDAGETEADAGTADHPGKAIADAIIAEINEQNAALDVNKILFASELDLQSMLEEDAARVSEAADARKAEIKEAQEKAKAGARVAAE